VLDKAVVAAGKSVRTRRGLAGCIEYSSLELVVSHLSTKIAQSESYERS
jgi:hypothetical protein